MRITSMLLLGAVMAGCDEAEDVSEADDGPDVVFIEKGVQDIDVGWSYRVHGCFDGAGEERCYDETSEWPTINGVLSIDAGIEDDDSWYVVVVY